MRQLRKAPVTGTDLAATVGHQDQAEGSAPLRTGIPGSRDQRSALRESQLQGGLRVAPSRVSIKADPSQLCWHASAHIVVGQVPFLSQSPILLWKESVGNSS